jgi:hypothetical protein
MIYRIALDGRVSVAVAPVGAGVGGEIDILREVN